jgi:hypothetical protein
MYNFGIKTAKKETSICRWADDKTNIMEAGLLGSSGSE